ncbi:MAG: hypothetical protein J1E34_09845, partial [Oscillospiraceae bacterium]|nr:hypothetical protein [Oscillospiraceae bacterium]
MQKKILSILMALLMVFTMFPATVFTVGADSAFGGGAGTAGSPYQIATVAHLTQLALDVKNGNAYSDKYFKLTADINLNGDSSNPWTPIGISAVYPFSGSFDGNNRKISGLYVSGTDYTGLFGYVSGANAAVKNLTVNGTVIGVKNVGSIVGWLNSGLIDNCVFFGTVSATEGNLVGGIVGCINSTSSTVQNCRNNGSLIGRGTYYGGIVGHNNKGTVSGCYNTGTISMDGISSSMSGSIGGIAGGNFGTVENSYNTGAVSASVYCNGVGGIVGINTSSAKVSQCYNAGEVSGTKYVGGLVGQNDGSAAVINCYNEETVNGTTNVGGIVGQNNAGDGKATTLGTVKNSYNRGSVTGTGNVGSVVGLNTAKKGTSVVSGIVTNNYYLQGLAGGITGVEVAGQAEEKTTAQFKSGEISWVLQNGQSSLVWVQNIINAPMDDYPLLYGTETGKNSPRVLKVTFKTYYNDSYGIAYTNNGGVVAVPADPVSPSTHVFKEWRCNSVNGSIFDKTHNTITGESDVDILAVYREKFGSEKEDDTIITTTYGVEKTQNLDSWVSYASGMTSSAGNFTYTLVSTDIDNNYYSLDENKLTIKKGLPVKDGGYTVTINVKENNPVLSTLSIDYGIYDVIPLTAKVIVNKATPEISVTASELGYGDTLADSELTGTATYLGENVPGIFEWATDTGIIPDMDYASIIGYPVKFTPTDTQNYNSVTVTVTVNISNASAEVTKAPVPLKGTYTGSLQNLITEEGTASGGTMKYFLTDSPELPDNAEFTSIVYSRVNVGTYYIWYKVIGDKNHTDSEPGYVVAT